MGWILCLALSLAPSLQDSRSLREAFLKEIDQPTKSGLSTKLDQCLALEQGVVRILHSSWLQSEKSIRDHQKQLLLQEKEVEKYDDTKPGTKGGDPFKFIKAKAKRNEIKNSIALLELYQGRILRGILAQNHKSEEKDLIRLLKDGPAILRGYSALTLGKMDQEPSTKALLDTLKRERNPLVRVALLEALSGKDQALVFFEKDLKHTHWQVQISAARALAETKDPASAEALIKLLPKVSGRVRNEFNASLKSITGVDKRGNPESWKAWWVENRESFLEGTYIPSIDERAANRGKSTFYGIKIESKRILFLLDVSPSMKRPTTWYPENPLARKELTGDRLIDVARFELKQMVRSLSKDTLFNVMVFWRDRKLALKKPGRGKGDRQDTLKFVEEISLQDGTDHWAAFSSAYETYGEASVKSNLPRLDFDTIYLISDGVPSQGIRDPKMFLEKLSDMNRFRKITTHTIALDPDGNGAHFLREIASITGGTYVER